MSLFDVIRYPISNPPTLEELQRLPGDLYQEWVSSTGWRADSSDPAWVSSWYKKHIHTAYYESVGPGDLAHLKQLIKDWGTDELI